MSTEPTVTVLSTLDERQQPVLNDCTLHTGWGAIVFKAGRASGVPVSVARALLRSRADIEVPELAGQLASQNAELALAAVEAAAPAEPLPSEGEIIEEPRREPPGREEVSPEEAKERAKAAIEHLRNEGMAVPPELLAAAGETDPPPPGAVPPEPPPPDDTGDPDSEDPPSDAPTHAKAIPGGFEARLASGELRCLAAKADGGQCANPAVASTSACGLGPHKAKVAELPDAA